MRRHLHALSVNVDADATAYSEAIRLGTGTRFTMVAKVVGDDGTAAVTLQGGWNAESAEDEDWVDTAMAATLGFGDFGQVVPSGSDGTIFIAFSAYRLKVEAADNTEALTVTAQVMELGA